MAVGTKVTNPVVVLTETEPVDNGGTPLSVSVAGFKGPPVTWQLAHKLIGVLIPVVVLIGFATGGIPLIIMVKTALEQVTVGSQTWNGTV